MIYHITTAAQWTAFEAADHYVADSLASEGFIHCSTDQQVAGVLDRYYTGQTGLVLLHIAPHLLKSELKYETATDNQKFPHIYGPIHKEAIVKATTLRA